jgi:hypothetical protein
MSLCLCSAGHDEICFDDSSVAAGECPVCFMETEKDGEIADLKSEVANLKDEIVILNRRLEAYR